MPQDPGDINYTTGQPITVPNAQPGSQYVPDVPKDSKPLSPESEAKIKKFNDKTDEIVVNALKGKAPAPPRPKAPKPPIEAYKYSAARTARKK